MILLSRVATGSFQSWMRGGVGAGSSQRRQHVHWLLHQPAVRDSAATRDTPCVPRYNKRSLCTPTDLMNANCFPSIRCMIMWSYRDVKVNFRNIINIRCDGNGRLMVECWHQRSVTNLGQRALSWFHRMEPDGSDMEPLRKHTVTQVYSHYASPRDDALVPRRGNVTSGTVVGVRTSCNWNR